MGTLNLAIHHFQTKVCFMLVFVPFTLKAYHLLRSEIFKGLNHSFIISSVPILYPYSFIIRPTRRGWNTAAISSSASGCIRFRIASVSSSNIAAFLDNQYQFIFSGFFSNNLIVPGFWDKLFQFIFSGFFSNK